MDTRDIQIFTFIAIFSGLCKVAGLLTAYFIDSNILYLILDWSGHLLFLILLLYVAKDLREVHNKKAWPVYLFIGASLALSVFNLVATHQRTDLLLSGIGMLTVNFIFCFHLFRTPYRFFALLFLTLFILSGLVPLLYGFLPAIQTQWIYQAVSLTRVSYPFALLYLVKTIKRKDSTDLIESIGKEIE